MRGVIMIFKYCFAKVTLLSSRWSLQVTKWLSDSRNSCKVDPACQNHQRTLAGSGTFSLLVSSDAAQGRWF